MSIGNQLREAREEKKLSVADVSAETKINKKYIQALENDNYLLIPSQVYAKGFLKAYSNYLGLDAKGLVGELINFYKNREEGRKTILSAQKIPNIVSFPKALKLPNIPELPKFEIDKTIITYIAGLLFVLFLFLLLIYGYVSSHHKRAILIQANPPAAVISEEAKVEPKKITAKITEESKAKASKVPAGKVEVKLEIIGRSWVLVTSGTKEIYSETLEPGSKLRFVGKEIKVKAGNSGAVKVYLNGKPLGLMGDEGVVVERTYKAKE